jgi:hypothetical protein
MKIPALFALALFTLVSVRADAPATFEVGGLQFTRPADWQWVEVTSPMRKAQLKVPGASADQAADITFFHFGAGGGGDVAANAQRWLAQFKSAEGAAKVEPQEIGGAKVTLVTTEGTFSSGMPGGPTSAIENAALLGAIIEAKDGNVFIKMTGPATMVKASRAKFLEFITAAITAKR